MRKRKQKSYYKPVKNIDNALKFTKAEQQLFDSEKAKAMEEDHSDGGYSFREIGEAQWFMVRCHKCQKENYAMAVALGICAWCDYKKM